MDTVRSFERGLFGDLGCGCWKQANRLGLRFEARRRCIPRQSGDAPRYRATRLKPPGRVQGHAIGAGWPGAVGADT